MASRPRLESICCLGLQVKNSQGEDVREDVMVDPEEQHDLDNSRGTCHFCLKWDKGARHQVGQGRAGRGGAGLGSWLQTCPHFSGGAYEAANTDSPLPPLPALPRLPQAYLNVEPVKGVTRPITADDANKASTGCLASMWQQQRGVAMVLQPRSASVLRCKRQLDLFQHKHALVTICTLAPITPHCPSLPLTAPAPSPAMPAPVAPSAVCAHDGL